MRRGGILVLLSLCLLGALAPGGSAEVVQKGDLRVSFTGKLSPAALPRTGTAPVGVSLGGRISTVAGTSPPQLRRIRLAINRNGRLDRHGLPACSLARIQPSTSAGALAACRSSLVGEGSFSADVELPQQAPFPSSGKVLAFNGSLRGRPVLLAHVFGVQPVPTSYTLVFRIAQGHGTYGTVFEASLPQVTGEWGFVTGLSLHLGRSFSFGGRRQSYLSAGCPAPEGFPSAPFALAKGSFSFAGGTTLSSVLARSCQVAGK